MKQIASRASRSSSMKIQGSLVTALLRIRLSAIFHGRLVQSARHVVNANLR